MALAFPRTSSPSSFPPPLFFFPNQGDFLSLMCVVCSSTHQNSFLHVFAPPYHPECFPASLGHGLA